MPETFSHGQYPLDQMQPQQPTSDQSPDANYVNRPNSI